MYKKCAAQLDLMIYFYRFRCRRPECPVPILSYFLSPFLFSPIFKPKPPIFPIFLLVKPKFVTKLEMELQLYVFQSEIYRKATVMSNTAALLRTVKNS